MSKLYDKYLSLKKLDSTKLYLFRCGNFYIFLGEDCEYINKFMVLKKTTFSKETNKCGFPVASKESYLKVIENLKIDIEIIEELEESENEISNVTSKYKELCEYINNINVNEITPIIALNIVVKLKEKINEGR